MKIVVAILLSIAIARASTPAPSSSPKDQFEQFKKDYHKKYGCPEEEKVRLLIFEKALEMIKENNEAYKKGNSSFTLGVNQFADVVGTEVPYGLFWNKTGEPPVKEFNQFKTDFKKTYECPELEKLRFYIFEMNFKMINEHNAKNSSYTLGINKFSDLLPQEVPKGLIPADKKKKIDA